MLEGDKYLDKLWEDYEGENRGKNLEKAIELYESELKKSPNSVEASWKLMKALYFLGTNFTDSNRKKQEIFEKAISIGEKIYKTKEGKLSAEVNLWMGINWGRWGETFGILESARKGVADKIRKYAEESIKINPKLDDGAAYKLLGRLHHKAPKIPLILSWPSKKKAIEYLEKAIEIAPNDIVSKMFLAEVLHDEGKKSKAIEMIKEIINNPPQKPTPEDEGNLKRCKKLLDKWEK